MSLSGDFFFSVEFAFPLLFRRSLGHGAITVTVCPTCSARETLLLGNSSQC